MANRNTLWAETFIKELGAAGLSAVCLAPGSRSTPLVLACAKQAGLQVYTHFDERSAGFFALGLAKATARPVALICTSGTAAANFLPAVVEAYQAQIPLLVLTADRPYELRDSGANQSIDQMGLYGRFAVWTVDVALPEAGPSALTLRSLRTLAARAYATAQGPRPGPVHLNFPFRKPLEPTPVPGDRTEPPTGAEPRDSAFTRIGYGTSVLAERDIDQFATAIGTSKRGLIVCGPDSPRGAQVLVGLEALATRTGFPLLADAASGLRFSGLPVFSGYDSYLALELAPAPDLVIRFGRVPTSATLNAYLLRSAPLEHWQISASGVWADDSHRLTTLLQTDEADFCERLAVKLEGPKNNEFLSTLENLETRTWAFWDECLADPALDASYVKVLTETLPDGSALFIGNSLAVRHLDQFGRARAGLETYANRGASGIDGVVSTALGVAASRADKHVTLLIGDLSLYHDMNGLLALNRGGVRTTVVLLNNGGGGIFHRLPIHNEEPEFTDYFLTPHTLEFRHAAALYGLEYIEVNDLEHFRDLISKPSEGSSLLEVKTSSHEDYKKWQALMKQYKTFLEETL